MIQRIQTVHLLLAFLFCVVAAFFPPFIVMEVQGATEYGYTNLHYMNILVYAIGLISLVTVFLFKNRPLQMRLCRLNALLTLGWIIWLAVELLLVYEALAEKQSLEFQVAGLLPVLTLFALLLALRGIRRDEKLVRSADRLR